MHRTLRAVSATAVALACAAPLAAQTTLAEYQLAGPLGEIGAGVADAGDVDGDGIHDLLVGGTSTGGSLLLTFSGADGSQLPGSFALGGAIGIGDLDGDGLRDVLTGNLFALSTYSRASGAALWSVQNLSPSNSGGRNACVLPDIDGDGVDDVAFGEPVAGGAPFGSGLVRLLSGVNGAVIRQINAPPGGDGFGLGCAPFADSDGDGIGDLLIGQSGYFEGGKKVGRALLVSTATGQQLLQLAGDGTLDNFGNGLIDGGDLDGDGLHDLVVRGFETSTATVAAYSYATLDPLWSKGGLPTSSLIATGDVDGDGLTDFVAARQGPPGQPGTAVVFAGADGGTLATLVGSSQLSYSSIAAPGDLDGDGTLELLVGVSASGTVPGSVQRAELRSLPSGSLLATFSNYANKMNLGYDATLVGDLDGDGHSDLATIGDSHVVPFSRASGAPLFVTKLPIVAAPTSDGQLSSITAPGDLSGDGVPDLVVGDGNELNVTKGRVFVVSGADGSLLNMLEGVQNQENLGYTVAATDDQNGDGVRDVWVTADLLFVGGKAGAGEVRLYSGATWQVLMTVHGAVQQNGNFGRSLSVGGDIDGDHVPDIAVGSLENIAGPNTGALYVLSGATGAVLQRLDGAFLSNGMTGLITGDADGDDVPDILGAEVCWNMCQGRVRLVSGKTGAGLWMAHGSGGNNNFGRRLARAGDLNGDGRADVTVAEFSAAGTPQLRLLSGLNGANLDVLAVEVNAASQIGASTAGLFDAGGCSDLMVGQPLHAGNGSLRVLASSQGGIHGFVDVGFAKAGSNGEVPSLRGYGGLAAGQVVTITARRMLPGAPGAWFIGLSAGNLPFKQGVLVPNPVGPFFVFPVAANGSGVFSISAPNPASVFTGLSLWHQMWFQDAGVVAGVSATNGMKETFK